VESLLTDPSNTRAVLSIALVSVGFLTSCGGSSSTAVAGDPASIELSVADVSFSSLLATSDLDATVRDDGGGVISANVSWSSDATSVASVSNQGVVTAVGNGTANVIATAGAVADTAEITVQQVAATLTLSPDTLRLPAVGDTATISRTVRDAGGSAMSGVPVTFATVDPAIATVNVNSGRVTAEGDGATTITAQVAPGGTGLTKSIRVEVGGLLAPAYLVGGYVGVAYTDQVGPASGGGTFTYSITAGALPPGLAINAANAQITGTPGGGSAGAHFFEVTATNGTLTLSERYAITISTQPSAAFNLWIAYNGGAMPPANTLTALNAALARWEEVVTGDAGTGVTYPPTGLTPGLCQLVDASLLNGAFIEDIAILMSIGPIDGPNNTLARGGNCGYGRQTLPAVISGQMKIDEADAGASAAFLEDVIWHEIGHALGIGTLWQNFTTGVGTPTVRYNGTNGTAEWTALGGAAGGVPLEPDIGAHWHEAYFNAEIMTPQAESPGTAQPISRVTVGALLDLGFGAVLGAADAYTLPGCSPACTAPARTEGGSGIPDVVFDRLLPLPTGSVTGDP
jgi:hypothetical protein